MLSRLLHGELTKILINGPLLMVMKNIFHRGAVALFPSQRRTGEKPRTVQGSAAEVAADQIETIVRAASSISRFKCFQKHS